ncbi:ferric-chelate reductase 1-like [Cyclopterus lumpus]|uniref:ferric-chelate reductase 1-like n=1 Tax=Cyclopterus lumpus TaxID=8103 RepID=UPI001486EA19|nr:ferric-chelate reductase 1-like [Cyclopterus lumpus]
MGLWILIGLNIITKVSGYSNGIFPMVCESMFPDHKTASASPFLPQNTTAPFDIIPEPGNEGDNITVFLKSTSLTPFRGFMLEARETINGNEIGNLTVGRFTTLESFPARLLTCKDSAGAAVSQRNNQMKTMSQVIWTPPSKPVAITFRATFIETFETFWINVEKNLVLPITPVRLPSTGIAMTLLDMFLVVLNMGLPNIFDSVRPGPLSRCLSKVSRICCTLLCTAVEIAALVLFVVSHPIQVLLVALVCVVMVINFIQLVVVFLPFGANNELKEIRGHAVNGCSVVHLMFTIGVIFVGIVKIVVCGKNGADSWLLLTMITFTVWAFLFVIWVFVTNTQRNAILGRRKIESPENSQSWREESKEKNLCGWILAAVSIIFIVGSLCFTVAIIVGLVGCQKEAGA